MATVLAGSMAGCGAAQNDRPLPTHLGTTPGVLQALSPGKIVFSGRGNAIHVMNPDGTGATQIAAGTDADFSPDGSKVVVAGGNGLQLMNPDGTGVVTINGDGWNARFSADGRRIVFVSGGAICVINTDGTDLKRLTATTGHEEARRTSPAFSPDGSTIVFSWSNALWTINADGTSARPLLADDHTNFTPVFTPDGTGIVFASSRTTTSRAETYTMDLQAQNIRPLTGDTTQLPPTIFYSTTLPAFSPDGRQLLVTRFTEDDPTRLRSEIWVMNADGTNPRRLSDPSISARAANWAPRRDS